MKLSQVIDSIEKLAPLPLAESYDNVGLLCGDLNSNVTGVLVSLDTTESVVVESIKRGLNVIVGFHPVIFKPFKKLTGEVYTERALIKAIKHDIAIYIIHTALDNVYHGVNDRICKKIGLKDVQILIPKKGLLKKLQTYVPLPYFEKVRDALFQAGSGNIGKYSSCSFSFKGEGTFMPKSDSNPFMGEKGEMSKETEQFLSVIYESHQESKILHTLFENHPYEEVAYELIPIGNVHQCIGSGMLGVLPKSVLEEEILKKIKQNFGLQMLKHSKLLGNPIKKIAVLGGSGSFAIEASISSKADLFITADLKYHDFFRAEGKILLADIGHYESEQYTIDLIEEYLKEHLPKIPIFKTEINTNPVFYF